MTLSVAMGTRKLAILLVGAAAKNLNNNIVTGKNALLRLLFSSSHKLLRFTLIDIGFTQ